MGKGIESNISQKTKQTERYKILLILKSGKALTPVCPAPRKLRQEAGHEYKRSSYTTK